MFTYSSLDDPLDGCVFHISTLQGVAWLYIRYKLSASLLKTSFTQPALLNEFSKHCNCVVSYICRWCGASKMSRVYMSVFASSTF